MKPFNLEQAKAGKPVVTRTGRPVRILCWDAKGSDPIVGLIELDFTSFACNYNENGIFREGVESEQDLFMKSEPKEGWVGIMKAVSGRLITTDIYSTKEHFDDVFCDRDPSSWVDVIKVEWQE